MSTHLRLLDAGISPVHKNWNTGMDAYDVLASGISVNGHAIPYWQIALFAVVLLLLIGLALLPLNVSRLRRRRKLNAELAAAERRATIEAQRIRQAEMEATNAGEEQSMLSMPPLEPMPSGAFRSPSRLLPVPSSALQPTEQACSRCGALNALDARYCGNCRQSLTREVAAQQPQELPQPVVPALPVPVHSVAEQATVVPAGALAEQPTIVPELSSLAEQPTIDLLSLNDAQQNLPEPQNDPEKTVPYSMRHLYGQRLGFVVGTRSDPGIKRRYKPNEDSLFAAQGIMGNGPAPTLFGLFVVADGMGGHANGEDASRLAIQTIINYLLPRVVESPPRTDNVDAMYLQLLAEGVQEANLAVYQNNMEQRADMGTTITATLLIDTSAYVANVGDSRTYIYRPSEGLRKITTDHSVVASLVEAGIIKPDDIYTHPKRHQIYRSLGEKPGVDIDTFTVQLQRGDKVLLCSDGLWDMVRDPKIEAVIKQSDPNSALTADALIQAALEGGGEDNVSVIVVHMTDVVDIRNMPRIQLVAKPDIVQMPQL
jgi:serine/threonine protein phosphatase PrpC